MLPEPRHFQHQLIALIQISRYLMARQVDRFTYIEHQELVAILNKPFDDLRNGRKSQRNAPSSIQLAREALRKYVKSRSDIAPSEVVRLMKLIEEARKKDELLSRNFLSLSLVKKIGNDRMEVKFILHETGGKRALWAQRGIRTGSGFPEWLLELNKNVVWPEIGVLDNPQFYVGFKEPCSVAEELGLQSHNEFCTKAAISDFQEIVESVNFNGTLHVLVDRNPRVQLLFVQDTHLLAVFSLAKILSPKDGPKAAILKGIDGTLYHIQQIIERLVLHKMDLAARRVYRLDSQMSGTTVEIPVGKGGWLDELNETYDTVFSMSSGDPSANWIVEVNLVPLSAQDRHPSTTIKEWSEFLGQKANPYLERMIRGMTEAEKRRGD